MRASFNKLTKCDRELDSILKPKFNRPNRTRGTFVGNKRRTCNLLDSTTKTFLPFRKFANIYNIDQTTSFNTTFSAHAQCQPLSEPTHSPINLEPYLI
ncbi:hypothetical protein EDD35_6931 [Amycolatopsis thermoflava]|uniref:Uncharacterized protein n=1 Tax=Amycolatopsis thermoflava TaxID=84480 RepID=A0A3N2H6E3_9PSEU|nr:hypothetical protein EDD35_6931 [Amycolatopsis thermoflava]